MTGPPNPYDPSAGDPARPAGTPPPPPGSGFPAGGGFPPASGDQQPSGRGYEPPSSPGYQQPVQGPGQGSEPTPPPYGGYQPAQPYDGSAGQVGRPGELTDRFLARLIDHVLLFVATMVIVTFLVVGTLMGGSVGLFSSGGNFLTTLVGALLGVAISLGYFAYMESSRGQTVGKMIMKLETRGADGGRPTMEEAVKRNIWMAISVLSIIPIIGGVLANLGQLAAMIFIAVGISGDPVARRGWHDKYAGTRVVKIG